MKFGDVILRQKLHQEIIKHLMTSFYDVFMTSSCILGSVWLKKVENPNFFVFFFPICLKFGTGSNFKMLITKSKPKLRLENNLH